MIEECTSTATNAHVPGSILPADSIRELDELISTRLQYLYLGRQEIRLQAKADLKLVLDITTCGMRL